MKYYAIFYGYISEGVTFFDNYVFAGGNVVSAIEFAKKEAEKVGREIFITNVYCEPCTSLSNPSA